MNQIHQLPVLKNIAMVNIPQYTEYNDFFHYAHKIGQYIDNYGIEKHIFSNIYVCKIDLSHLDCTHYKVAIIKCETNIDVSTNIHHIY